MERKNFSFDELDEIISEVQSIKNRAEGILGRLSRMKAQAVSPAHAPKGAARSNSFMRLNDVCEKYSIGVTTARKLVGMSGCAHKVGRLILVDAEGFDSFIRTYQMEEEY